MMTASTAPDLTSFEGRLAPPRKNGELVFEAPWESRAFGLAIAVSQGGAFDWQAFSDQLATELGSAAQPETSADYYEHWLAAFERVAIAHRLLTPAEINAKADEIAAHDDHAGHDHDHEEH